MATRLARRHGLRWYNADTRTWAHRDRAIGEANAAAMRWEALSPAERSVLPAAEALAGSLHHDRGPMVVDDIRRLPASPLVVAEGSVLSPALAERSHALWLLPTPAFQRAQLDERALPDGARALYLLLAETIERDARAHDVPVLEVDGSLSIEETVTAVEAHFAATLARGPRAATLAERRELLREANAAVVMQVRSFYARPWARGDAETVERAFLCECGDTGCSESVEATVAAAAARPLLAATHR